MRIKGGKRFTVTLIAGALTTVMVLAGTFAWFTFTLPSIEETPHKVASIILKSDDESLNVKVRKFNDSRTAKDIQDTVEDLSSNNDQSVLDRFGKLMFTEFNPNIYNPSGLTWDKWMDTLLDKQDDLVMPGSFISSSCKFKNTIESDVPAYLRIKVDQPDPNVNKMKASYFTVIYDKDGRIIKGYKEFTKNDETYYYFSDPLYPLAPEEDEYNLMFCAYVFGNSNSSDTMMGDGGTFKLGSAVTAELIQASNNAVYLADGWKDVAVDNNGKDFFKPPA